MINLLKRRIGKIIRGQVRSYMADHPEMFSDRGRAQRHMIANGICKRAINEVLAVGIVCGQEGGASGSTLGSPLQVPAEVVDRPEPTGAASAGRPHTPENLRVVGQCLNCHVQIVSYGPDYSPRDDCGDPECEHPDELCSSEECAAKRAALRQGRAA